MGFRSISRSELKEALFGFYYGIGDFISAVPVLRHLSKKDGYKVTALIGYRNIPLTEFLDLERVDFLPFNLLSASRAAESLRLIRKIAAKKPALFFVSPHVQDKLTSWKIPIALKIVKLLNPKMVITGALGDRNSFLYDRKLGIGKDIPLMKREIAFARKAGLMKEDEKVSITGIFKLHARPGKVISIHPGASKRIKSWRAANYSRLVEKLVSKYKGYRIKFFGLPNELNEIRASLNHLPDVEFNSGTLKSAILGILDSEVILTMDSGFSHIASSLGLKHLVLFGPGDPALNMPIFKNTKFIFKKNFQCQPCNDEKCKLGKNFCMDAITPDDLFENITQILDTGRVSDKRGAA